MPKTTKKTAVVVVEKKHAKPTAKQAKQKGSRAIVLKGHGGYVADLASKGGAAIGKFLGNSAESIFGKIFGFGDYRTRAAALNMGNSPPSFASSGPPVVCHREFIGNVYSSTAFTLTSYPINPGITATFPWLGPMSWNFEQYIPEGLLFEYKPLSADALASTNTALGTVVMSTEYDSSKPNFTSRLEMENYEYTTSTKPSDAMLHPVECSNKMNPLGEYYVRSVTGTVSQDIKFYDIGKLQVATEGMQAAGVLIGELWATYKFKFIKPRLGTTGLVNPLGWTHLRSFPTIATQPLANATVISGACGVTVTQTNSVLSFATPGRYMVMAGVTQGSPPANNYMSFAISGTATYLTWASLFNSGTGVPFFNGGTTSTSTGNICGFAVIDVNKAADLTLANPQGLIIGVGASLGTSPNLDVVIVSLPSLTTPSEVQPLCMSDLLDSFREFQDRLKRLEVETTVPSIGQCEYVAVRSPHMR